MQTFRVIDEPPLPGALNMAVDQALLEECGETGEATLRFYGWEPATLSLGYFQALEDRQEHRASRSLAAVRRVTGGGAIVHDRELTYSLVVPLDDRWAARHQELYGMVHGIIVECLAEWRIGCQVWPVAGSGADAGSERAFLCFQRRSPGDLVVGDYKVCGSAQRRSRRALLQHGSILLRASSFAPELPGLAELGSTTIDAGELSRAMVEYLARHFAARPVVAAAPLADSPRVQEWLAGRFANPAWTSRERN